MPTAPTSIDRLASVLADRTPLELDAREQAAVAVLLAGDPRAPDLLLIERAVREGDPWSGHMALPGGRRDPEDPDLWATALRETREEVGVDLGAARFVGRLDDLRPIRRSNLPLAVRPFVFFEHARPGLALSDEVASALWVPFASLPERAGEARIRHRGEELDVPAFVVERRVVWGMTQRVLAGLLEHAAARGA